MKAKQLNLPIDINSLLEEGHTLLLVSEFDYCIVKLIDSNIVDVQTNVEIDIGKHLYHLAYILLEEIPKDILAKDDVERFFHLSSIRKG